MMITTAMDTTMMAIMMMVIMTMDTTMMVIMMMATTEDNI